MNKTKFATAVGVALKRGVLVTLVSSGVQQAFADEPEVKSESFLEEVFVTGPARCGQTALGFPKTKGRDCWLLVNG